MFVIDCQTLFNLVGNFLKLFFFVLFSLFCLCVQPRQVQRRVIESTRLLEQSQRRLAALEQERFYLGITKEELEKPCPAVYNSIGKVFILMTQDEARADVERRIKDLDEETAAVTVCSFLCTHTNR